jgi:type II secretory pathway component PulF
MFTAQLSTRRLAEFCRRVGVSLQAGIDLRKVLDREVDRAGGGQRQALDQIRQAIARGNSLDEALATANGLFPPMVRGMVQVGEQSGKMDEAFLKLAEHYDRQLSLRRTFIAGIIWPAIQLAGAVLIIGLLIWVLGIINRGKPDDEVIDLLGFGLMGNTGVAIYAMIVIVLAIVGVVLYRAAAAGLAWSRPLQRAVMAVPVLGGSLKTLALARLAWTLAVTHDTGMDTIRAVTLAVANAHNVIYTSGLDQIAAVIRRGGTISEGMKAAGGYPQDFLDTLEVGEDTGQISESMAHLSQLYESRARTAFGALAVLAGFLVWGLVAAIIIFFIFRLFFAVYGPILDGDPFN